MPNICNTNILFKGNYKDLNNLEEAIKKEDSSYGNNNFIISFEDVAKKVAPCKISTIYQILNINEDELYFNDPEKKLKSETDTKINDYIQANKWIGLREDYINERIFDTHFKREKYQLEINLEMAWYCPVQFFIYMAKKYKVEVMIVEKVQGNFTHIVFLEKKEYKYIEFNIENILKFPKMQDTAIALGLTSSVELLFLAIYTNQELLGKAFVIKYAISDLQITNYIKSLYYLFDEDFYDCYEEFLLSKLAQQENFHTLIQNLEINARLFVDFFK